MLKEILSDLKEFGVWISNWFFYRRQSIKMTLAIKLADIKQKAFNRQYHIMLLSLPKGDKLVSVCRADIENFKRKKWLPKTTVMSELVHSNSVFYSTALNLNNKSTTEERKTAKEKYLKYAKKYMKG